MRFQSASQHKTKQAVGAFTTYGVVFQFFLGGGSLLGRLRLLLCGHLPDLNLWLFMHDGVWLGVGHGYHSTHALTAREKHLRALCRLGQHAWCVWPQHRCEVPRGPQAYFFWVWWVSASAWWRLKWGWVRLGRWLELAVRNRGWPVIVASFWGWILGFEIVVLLLLLLLLLHAAESWRKFPTVLMVLLCSLLVGLPWRRGWLVLLWAAAVATLLLLLLKTGWHPSFLSTTTLELVGFVKLVKLPLVTLALLWTATIARIAGRERI